MGAGDDRDKRVSIAISNLASYGTMSDASRVRAGIPRVRLLSDKPSTLRIKDSDDGGPATLDIFGEIGWSWFGDGIEAGEFSDQLSAITAPSITVRINSPGGDVFDGLAILNLIRAHPANIDVVVMGLAASAASLISMGGTTLTMMPQSEMMIHDASGVCMGNPADMAAMGDLLNHVSDNIAGAYAQRSGKPAADWRTAMRTETWYTADEAVTAGLADRVGDVAAKQAGAATNTWNLSFYLYAGRAAAPTPKQPAPAVPEPVFLFDPEMFRTAMKEARR